MEGRNAFTSFAIRTLAVLAIAAIASGSDQVRYPFQGVRWTHRVTTVPRPLQINILQIDVDYPGIGMFATPGNGDAPLDVDARKTTTFVDEFGLQVGINADFFEPASSTHPEGTNLDVLGLGVSDGIEYSAHAGNPALYCDAYNVPGIARFAGAPPTTIVTAVGGNRIIVDAGAVTAEASADAFATDLHPRTFAGISADGETLILAVVDGRQTGFSEGMQLTEAANLLIEFGAWTGINLDGGGSSTMVFDRGTGPAIVNSPSDVAGERVVGNHLGLNAPAIPTVAIPNGGEVWIQGTAREITWRPELYIQAVALEYSLDGGVNWTPIIEATANDGSFEWTVPVVVSSTCLVRLLDAGNPELYDESDGTFAIRDTDAYVDSDPVVTFGSVIGGTINDTTALDGLGMTLVEGARGSGALSLRAEFVLLTATPRAQVASLALSFVGSWTDLDGVSDALRIYCADASGVAWTEITSAIRATGIWSPATPRAYVNDSGAIRVLFTDTAAVKKEKKGVLSVDLLYAEITAGPLGTDPPSAQTLHVAAVQMSTEASGRNTKAVATLLIQDKAGTPVLGATVSGDWYLDGAFIESCTSLPSSAQGSVAVSSSPRRVRSGQTFRLVVTGITLTGCTYEPGDNVPSPADYEIQAP